MTAAGRRRHLPGRDAPLRRPSPLEGRRAAPQPRAKARGASRGQEMRRDLPRKFPSVGSNYLLFVQGRGDDGSSLSLGFGDLAARGQLLDVGLHYSAQDSPRSAWRARLVPSVERGRLVGSS